MISLVVLQLWHKWFSTGVGKLWPEGHMLPVKVFNPAHQA